MPKIISERRELVKLCYIHCSGPFFLRHTVMSNLLHLYFDKQKSISLNIVHSPFEGLEKFWPFVASRLNPACPGESASR